MDLKRGATAWLALPGEITRLLAERPAPAPVTPASSLLLRLAGLALAAGGAALLTYGWGRVPGWQELAGVAALTAGVFLALRLRY
jgi:ferric-dicitrate binding protein FerR (iron transport regulator)